MGFFGAERKKSPLTDTAYNKHVCNLLLPTSSIDSCNFHKISTKFSEFSSELDGICGAIFPSRRARSIHASVQTCSATAKIQQNRATNSAKYSKVHQWYSVNSQLRDLHVLSQSLPTPCPCLCDTSLAVSNAIQTSSTHPNLKKPQPSCNKPTLVLLYTSRHPWSRHCAGECALKNLW